MSTLLQTQSLVRVPGLTDDEMGLVNALLARLTKKQTRNLLRTKYYDAKQVTRNLGIAIPPQLNSIETVIGWPAKSVDDLEQRIDLEGFVIPGAQWGDFGLDKIWYDNRLSLESSQAHASALKYACSFVAVLAGQEGQPEVVIRPLSALTSTGLWDSVLRRMDSALTVTDVDPTGRITEFILLTADDVVTCSVDEAGRWSVERSGNVLNRAPVAVLPFKPDLESPFGTSRISRAVMSITDRAVRSLLRMEVSAEFYSAPQRYVLGADEKAFKGPNGELKTGWEVTLGKMLLLDRDPDAGDDKGPQVGQFPQMTMQPHMDMVRSDASLFSGETGIPVNSLGIIHDNPASDAAMQTAYLPLVKTAERAAVPFGLGWVDAMNMAVQVRDGLAAPDPGMAGMRAKFRNPATSTRTEASNATAQFITAFPWAAESEVALEMFGVDRVDIDRLIADKRRGTVSALVNSLPAAVQAATEDPAIADLASQRGNSD